MIDAYLHVTDEKKALFCDGKCDETRSAEFATYCPDGGCGDMHKDHWHCGDCGKINQIG